MILNSVVLPIFGKSVTSANDCLIEQSNNPINYEEIISKLLCFLKTKPDSVIESIEGYQMTDYRKDRMRFIRARLD